ncbi:AMP-binding protein [Aeromicrobium duanguangcaii]|uniref:AMP-binding protein n=2 Tax=Aeromicrobium duanguangcaii TaxID=2968086 RepID=A0ABY5KDM5_9ACTN|nr:AMP-binding protein [Aeromicrobium duanguangcaii]MCD9155221.1 AMP-binding protein [Aeromicrobium duanguangcaii]UUI68128.1 AMP-binding protein [Aeromicrobium duanguangcaii]
MKVLRRMGVIKALPPHKLIGAARQLKKWGPGLPSGVNAAAKRYPKQVAIVDDAGEITYEDLVAQINQYTEVLRDRGLQPGDSVAVLARNHRYLVIALIAVVQLGGRVLLLNTMSSRAQLTDLAEREGAELLILDQEFLPLVEDVRRSRLMLAWADADAPGDLPSIESSTVGKPSGDQPLPAKHGEMIIFTSGTTGLPKGAKRKEPDDLKPVLAFFGSIPYRSNSVVAIGAPLFHSWGLINLGFGLSTCPTFVFRRRFNPEQTLQDIEKYKVEVLVVVPLMLQRMVKADPQVVKNTDVSSLKITASSGSALAGDLALHYMDMFTDSIYNFYGATETSWITIADPKDLRAAPGTAGRVPWRTTVKILDHDGNEVPQGDIGVIHVVNDMPFGGYTDGRNKSFHSGLMDSGDLGYFDEEGRLFVAGRDDDMIISGGENVFPRELEDCLVEHPEVADVVVTGIADPEWGQRLAAYVVRKEGSDVSADELVQFAKDNVARSAVPRGVMFLESLPRNPTGKVMKRQLPAFETTV